MDTRGFCLFFLIIVIGCQAKNTLKSPPHIIVIVADDLGWNDVSFHGSPQIPTPNIDAMAADGLILSNYYVQPLCTPSRAALMTGFYPIHTGTQSLVVIGRAPSAVPSNFTFLSQHLKNLGYSTHGVGKWHLGSYKKEYLPTSRGFDSFYGSWYSHAGYYDQMYLENPYFGLDLHDNLEPVRNETGHYVTNLFTEKAATVIETHNSTKPLFLYLAHRAVHFGNDYAPLETTPDLVARFPHIRNYERRLMAGLVSSLDDSIGRIFEALDYSGMLQNSVIVLTTDNGAQSQGYCGQRGCGPELESVSSNYPLRGSKFDLWEGGVKGVSLIWSSLIPSPKKGKFNERKQLMHISDWLPTLYHVAGGDPKDLGELDGVNMWDALSSNTKSPRVEMLLNIDPLFNMRGIRNGSMKLLEGDLSTEISYFTKGWLGETGRDAASLEILGTLPILTNLSEVANALRQSGRAFHPPTSKFYDQFNISCGPAPLSTIDDVALFDIEKDPCEYENIASLFPEIVKNLQAKMDIYAKSAALPFSLDFQERCNPDLYGNLWTNWGDDNPITISENEVYRFSEPKLFN